RTDEGWISSFRARRDERLRTSLTEIPGPVATVEELSRLFEERIACATGAVLQKARLQLQLTGFAPHFKGRIFSGMELPRSKPAPDVYLAAAAALRVDAAEAIVIEDTVSGVTSGVVAGATVFGFAPRGPTHTPAERFREAGSAHIF